MEVVRRRSGSGCLSMVVAIMCAFVVVMVPGALATRWTVGGNMGWNTNVNYTVWAQDKHFYNGDWLFFVYDRNQMNVLEVNKTDYESCNSDNFLHNWTTGAGRDVVPLNVTRNYYIISGKGFCYGGMKLAIHVENLPPPPSSTPLDEKSSSPTLTSRGMIVLPMVLAIGAVWDAFFWYW
ncbi:lamin-like protein [Quercus lobata]|uniref:Phytocyanin domain-containing protein n=1 Tax=Quercus lobata TaxID=97700 RepID=A0A7N2QZ30_QUELO|nr:lamin-like protein [Quercus lobata]